MGYTTDRIGNSSMENLVNSYFLIFENKMKVNKKEITRTKYVWVQRLGTVKSEKKILCENFIL